MFNCKKLFKPQIRPPSLMLLIAASQDRWIFPRQSWEVRNSTIMKFIVKATKPEVTRCCVFCGKYLTDSCKNRLVLIDGRSESRNWKWSDTSTSEIRHYKQNILQQKYYKQKQTAGADCVNSLTRQQIASYQLARYWENNNTLRGKIDSVCWTAL